MQSMDDPASLLSAHILVMKRWFLSRKRKQQDHEPEDSRPRRPNLVYRRLDAWGSVFGEDILQNPHIQDPTHPDGIKFRLRFRVPYSVFQSIVANFRSRDGWNPAGDSGDLRAHTPHPLEVKVLCALFILGRGIDLDTVSMLSGISISRITIFFHHFCEKMATMYDEYICMPSGDDLERVTAQYARMGFPGCVGSTDCVHFYWDRCPHNVRHLHQGKEGKPTVAYSLIADHSRRIRSLTVGHPGARNDKSISQYDRSIQDIRAKRLYQNESFKLYDAHGRQHVHVGLYLLCDGGYHKWRIMQCPNKHASEEYQLRFSQRLESVRKDAECTFGILKKRWRILKNHMLIQNKNKIDNIVFTCAILHNILLDFDEWNDSDDNYDIAKDIAAHSLDPRIENLRRSPADRSYIGGGNLLDGDVEVESEWASLRRNLVENYMYCFNTNQIVW
jgi:hypothetical protein